MVVCSAAFIAVVLVASICTALTAVIAIALKVLIASYLRAFVVVALVFFTAVVLAIHAVIMLGSSGRSALHDASDNETYLIVAAWCPWWCTVLGPPREYIGEGGILELNQWLSHFRRFSMHTTCSGAPVLPPACRACFFMSL
jgi:hypothetical protein